MSHYKLKYVKSKKGKENIRKFIKNYYRTKPLEVLNIADGTILPRKEADKKLYPNTWMGLGGVLDKDGEFVKISGIKALYSDDLVFGGKYDYSEVEECNENVLYMGVFQPQWGHFLVEYCTRLWYSIKNDNQYKIVYCGYNCRKGEVPEPYLEFLKLLGIKKEQLVDIRKPIKYKKIIVPQQSFLRNQYFTDEYKFIINTAYNNINKNGLVPYKKIYFTRNLFIKNNKPDVEVGEKEIQETFQKNGYKILAPETLSVEEQIFYVRNCEEFVAIPSSTSDNAVFAADKTKRIYIRKAFKAVPEEFQIDQMTNAESITFIDCYYEPYQRFPLTYGGGPHFIGATKEFGAFLKDNDMLPLNKAVYGAALVETWCWLTKIALRDNEKVKAFEEKMLLCKIKAAVHKLLRQKEEKIIIYPYGRIGNIAQNILDEKGIKTYLIVDHYKCCEDKTIYDTDMFEDDRYLDYKILLCSDVRSYSHKVVKDTVYRAVKEKERILEIF